MSAVRVCGYLLDDRLKLLLRQPAARSLAEVNVGKSGCSGVPAGRRRRLHGANCLGKIEAGFFVLGAQVIPAANHGGEDDATATAEMSQGGTVFYRPMGGFFGGVDGDTAEGILFKLMAGFCAHGFPFWL